MLVIVDLLQDFFDAKIWPQSILPASRNELAVKTNELAALCRSHKISVVWFRQEFKSDLSDAFPHMRKSEKIYTISGTEGCELLPELDVHPNDHVMLKSRFSAFFRTNLEALLQERKIDRVILAGITTAWCIRSTAVDAYQRDYEVIVAKECVQAFSEKEQEESIRAMDGYIATFLSNTEIIDGDS